MDIEDYIEDFVKCLKALRCNRNKTEQPDFQIFFDFGDNFYGHPKVLCQSAPH